MKAPTRPTLEALQQLSDDELVELVLTLFDVTEQPAAQVTHLTARVAELETQLSKNSTNYGKPPSSDGL